MGEVIKIGIRRGHGGNSYSLMMGDFAGSSTAHDISMGEALGLVKEEMEKLGEGEEGMMEEEVCAVCGRTFEPAEGEGTFTCSEVCSQTMTDRLVRGLPKFAKESDERWEALRSWTQKKLGVTVPPFTPTAIILIEVLLECLKNAKSEEPRPHGFANKVPFAHKVGWVLLKVEFLRISYPKLTFSGK